MAALGRASCRDQAGVVYPALSALLFALFDWLPFAQEAHVGS